MLRTFAIGNGFDLMKITIFRLYWAIFIYNVRNAVEIAPIIVSVKYRLGIPERIPDFYISKQNQEKEKQR
jgi:hypothetical protein